MSRNSTVGNFFHSFFCTSIIVSVVFSALTAQAAVTTTGDVDPANPSTWTNSTTGYIGKTTTGTLTVDGDSDLLSYYGYLGYNFGSSGMATITGTGSTWKNSYALSVGKSGSGTLNIEAGGDVRSCFVVLGDNSGSNGKATLSGTGSKLTIVDDTLFIGYSGTGNMYQTGGTVLTYRVFLGCSFNGKGTYNLNGGTLILQSLVKGSGTAAFNFGGGTLQARSSFSTTLPMTLTGDGGNANVDTVGYTVTLAGLISGKGGLNKLGSGTLEFAKGIDVTDTTVLDIQAGKAVLKTVNITETNLHIATAPSTTFEVINGVHEVGEILGGGKTQVDSGARLTVSSIVQGMLTIGSGAKVTIRPLGGGPLSGSSLAVPEPSTLVLLVSSFMLFAFAWAKRLHW